jgi:uncharacterized phage-associated protein
MTTEPQYRPLEVANTLIGMCQPAGIEHMKLQKLLFYTYGWWLAFRDKPFMSEKPEVWRYGPVFSSVYWTFNHYGSRPIDATESDNPFSKNSPSIPTSDVDSMSFLDWIRKRYGGFSSLQLSDMTHQPGTPWQIVAAKHGYSVPKHLEIDDEITRSYFTTLAKREGVAI